MGWALTWRLQGRISFHSHSCCWQNTVPWVVWLGAHFPTGCRPRVSSACRGCARVLHMIRFMFKVSSGVSNPCSLNLSDLHSATCWGKLSALKGSADQVRSTQIISLIKLTDLVLLFPQQSPFPAKPRFLMD